MTDRIEKVRGELIKHAANYIEGEANRLSLITVTDCIVTPDLKKATIYISVFPETKEKAAIDFLKRKRSEIRDYVKKRFQAKTLPFFDVELDKGEKRRQEMDELFRKIQ